MKSCINKSSFHQKTVGIHPFGKNICLFRSNLLTPKIILVILFINYSLLITNCFAQPTQEWVARYNNNGLNAYGTSVKVDTMGNVYVLMALQTDTTNGDYCVLKYSPSGSLIWKSFYNSPGNLIDNPIAFDIDLNGNIYVTGTSGINFNYHITTVKFNTNGILQWAKRFISGAGDVANDLKVDKDGNIIIAGGGYNGSSPAALVVKYDSNGDSLWVKKVSQLSNSTTLENFVLDDSNNVYAVGYIGSDYLMLKYYSNGTLAWNRTYNSPQNYFDIAQRITVDNSHNVYVVGTNSVPGASSNNTLLRLYINGLLQWAKTFTGIISTPGYCQRPKGIVLSSDNFFVYYTTFCANESSGTDIVTLKYNSSGDSIWVRRYWGGVNSTPNESNAIKIDGYDNIYITGRAYYPGSGDNYVTIKYLPVGTQQWVATYNGPLTNSNDYARDLYIDNRYNFYVTGNSSRQNSPEFLWEAATIKYSQPIGIINNNNEFPITYKLYQNYPNPFNSTTIITYELPKESDVKLKLFNSAGELVRILTNSKQSAGYYSIAVNMIDLASGIYFYSLLLNNSIIETRKLILIK